jgi:hypothetical protein
MREEVAIAEGQAVESLVLRLTMPIKSILGPDLREQGYLPVRNWGKSLLQSMF